MADYHSPTVVRPPIPLVDITALELMLLRLIFDESMELDASYYHSWCGPSETLTVDAEELRLAHAGSREASFPLNELVGSLLAQYDATGEDRSDEIDIDLTGPGQGWPEIFQAIVQRSATLEEIVVTTSFTCTKMRPDCFGGSVMRITPGAIQYSSTDEILLAMYDEQADVQQAGDGHDTRSQLATIANVAGWDSFTLLLLISRWLDQTRQAEMLVAHLDQLASAEEE